MMKPVRGVIFLILGGCCPVGISFPGIFLLLKKLLTSRKICPRYPLEELLLYKLHSSPPLVERHQGLPFLSIFFFYRDGEISFTALLLAIWSAIALLNCPQNCQVWLRN